jgi:predicted SpoU family rRNA methylase
MNYIRRMKSDAPKRIETVEQLVAAFGGTFKLAKWADVVPSTVSNWKEQGHIPPGWHLRLYLECQQRNLNVSKKLFGLEAKAPSRRPNKRTAELHSAVR